jgi:elongation factor G
MSEILKYALVLNAIPAGRGTFRVEHSHYDEVPASLMDKIIAEHKKKVEE